jgi:3-(3-hydroxy-phenyl)propionate hydroxylase
MTSIRPRLGPGVAAGWNGLAGHIAPQPRLADGTELDDRVGYRFAALLQPDFAADLPPDTLGRLVDRDVVVVADDAPEPQAWLQAADASAILVRPDRYVLGAVHSVRELNALIAAI